MEVVTVTGKDNQTYVVGVNHGVAGPRGLTGSPAGFDIPTASVTALSADQNPTVSVTATGPDTNKQFDFQFGIPNAGVVQADWNQTDTSADDYIENKPTKVSDFQNDSHFVTETNLQSNYYDKTSTDSKLALKEDKSNKVTSISDQSTDAQYPSAKAVYDTIESAKPNLYEITDVYLRYDDDVTFTVRRKGEPCINEGFRLKFIFSGNGSTGYVGYYDVTTDSYGRIGSLGNVTSQYTDNWIDNKTGISTLGLIIADTSGNWLCDTSITRNLVTNTVSNGEEIAVTGTAVADYAEAKSNKTYQINSSSTDTQYPSAAAVYRQVTAINDTLATKESTSNKVTVINSGSSDTDYPSARAVYTEVNYLNQLAQTKEDKSNKTTVVDENSTDVEYPSAKAVYEGLNTVKADSVNRYNDLLNRAELKVNKTNTITSASTDTQYPTARAVYNAIQSIPQTEQQQSDWTQSDSTSVSYIKHKPSLASVATSGSYNDLINKPVIPTVPTNVSAFVNDAGYVTASQVPAAQVNSDWNASSGVSQILNKPNLSLKEDKSNKVTEIESTSTNTQYPSAKATYDLVNETYTTLNTAKEDKSNKVTSISSSSTNTQYPSAKAVYDAIQNIPVSQQVQSDWDQTDTTAPDYIKNKPSSTLQEQADWTESNTTSPSYIKHKPNLNLKEDVSNKTTSINASSTNTQYPTAAAVYNAIQNIPVIVDAQSDWTETDTTSSSYIKHKPDLSLKLDTSAVDTSFPVSPSDSHVPSTKLVHDALADKVNSAVVGSTGAAKVSTFISTVQDNDVTVPTGHGVMSYLENTLVDIFDNLDYRDSPTTYQYVTSVSQQDGLISVSKDTMVATITSDTSRDNNPPTTAAVKAYFGDVIGTAETYTDNSIAALDYTDNVSGDYVTSVSETNGVVSLTKGHKGTITSGSTGLVDGDTVYNAIQNIPITTQAQANWNESDSSSPSYIQNKPDLSLKEDVSNKVLAISSSSTDTEYPSARAVYNSLNAFVGSGFISNNILVNEPVLTYDTIFPDCPVGTIMRVRYSKPGESGRKLTFPEDDTRYFLDLQTGNIYYYGHDFESGNGSTYITEYGNSLFLKLNGSPFHEYTNINFSDLDGSIPATVYNRYVSSMTVGQIKYVKFNYYSCKSAGVSGAKAIYRVYTPTTSNTTYRALNLRTLEEYVVGNGVQLAEYEVGIQSKPVTDMFEIERLT